MAEQTKDANINEVWASNGDTGTDPGTGKRELGFVQEKPTFQLMNHVLNLLQGYTKHVNEQGIGDWDAGTNYAVGGLAKGSDDVVYRSLSPDNVNVDPVGENADWEIAFVSARNHQGNVGIGGDVSNWATGMDVIQINDAGTIAVDDAGAMYLLVNAYMDSLSFWRSFWTNPTPMMLRMKDGNVELFTSLTSGTNAAIAWDLVMKMSSSEFNVNGKNIIANAIMIKTGGGYLQSYQTDVKSIDFAGDGLSALYLSYNTVYDVKFGFKDTSASARSESIVGTFDLSPPLHKVRWGTNGNSILALNDTIDSILIYPVSTPWDSTTADLTLASSTSFPLSALSNKGFAQTRDGNVIYTLSQATSGTTTFTIIAHTLQSAYDYSNVAFTSSYTKPIFESPISSVYDIAVSADGKTLYVLAANSVAGDDPFFIITMSISSQGDMTNVVIEGESFVDPAVSGVIYPYGISVNESGDKLVVIGKSTYGMKDMAIVRGTNGI